MSGTSTLCDLNMRNATGWPHDGAGTITGQPEETQFPLSPRHPPMEPEAFVDERQMGDALTELQRDGF